MNRDTLVVVLITAMSFLLLNTAALVWIKYDRAMHPQPAAADSLAALPDSLAAADGSTLADQLPNLIQASLEPLHMEEYAQSPAKLDKTRGMLISGVKALGSEYHSQVQKVDSLHAKLRQADSLLAQRDQRIAGLLADLDNTRKQSEQQQANRDALKQQNDQNIKNLVTWYEEMKPETAASSMALLGDDKVIELLNMMSSRTRTRIITALPADRSARLARRMAQ